MGVVGLLAVIGTFACLVTTSSDRPAGDSPNILERSSIGPLIGGLLLVATSAFDGLALSETAAWLLFVPAVVLIVTIRFRWPKLPTQVRRTLVTPFTLVAGGLFGDLTGQIANGFRLTGGDGQIDLGGLGLLLGFFVLRSGGLTRAAR